MRGSLNTWLILGVLLSTIGYAVAEDITLTTYYPSPRGVYKELQTTNNAFFATQGGSVGVGTNTPGAMLEVNSTGTPAAPALKITPDPAQTANPLVIGTTIPGKSIVVTPEGNIGVQTTTTGDFDGGNTGTSMVLKGDIRATLLLNAGDQVIGGLGAMVFDLDPPGPGLVASPGLNFGTGSNHPLTFFTGFQPRMAIDQTGRVGIGKVSGIAAQLEVRMSTPMTANNIALKVVNDLPYAPPPDTPIGLYAEGASAGAVVRNTSTAPGLPALIVQSGAGTAGQSAHFMGRLRIEDGTQGQGRVLTSDQFGYTSWQKFQPTVWLSPELLGGGTNPKTLDLGIHAYCALSKVQFWETFDWAVDERCEVSWSGPGTTWTLNLFCTTAFGNHCRCRAICFD